MSTTFHLPFTLPPASKVLVAGCGGGYDVVCALPVALALRDAGHHVEMASYSFSELKESPGLDQPLKGLYRIDKDSQPPASGYFPEGFLARWWHQELAEDLQVWAYRKVGVVPLTEMFRYLQKERQITAVVVVDAGVDALFWGNEPDLGTPEPDAASLLAAYAAPDWQRIFAFTAFGSEGAGYSVRHADALMRVSQLIQVDALLGVSPLLRNCPEGELFVRAAQFIHDQMESHWHSKMVSSLLSAMGGEFGPITLSQKEGQLPTWISPLTLLYWFLRLEPVAEAKPYLREALRSETVHDLNRAIDEVRERLEPLPDSNIPI